MIEDLDSMTHGKPAGHPPSGAAASLLPKLNGAVGITEEDTESNESLQKHPHSRSEGELDWMKPILTPVYCNNYYIIIAKSSHTAKPTTVSLTTR